MSSTQGVNPMNDLQACILLACKSKSFSKSLVVTSVVKLNPLALVFTFKYKNCLIEKNLATSDFKKYKLVCHSLDRGEVLIKMLGTETLEARNNEGGKKIGYCSQSWNE